MINPVRHYAPVDPSSPVLNFHYSPSDLIGKGFTSQVYKGVSTITGIPLAIKVIDKNLLKEEDRKLIKSEIASMRKVRGKSPFVLNLIEISEVGQTVYLVTEQCDCDLAKVLQEQRLAQKQAIDLMEEIIKGYLSIAHGGIVHRDLKPANIFLKNGHVKIGDFGFAISFEQCATCHNVGSPLYMSPQAMNLTQYSVKSDIWALGITFYQLLFGSVPWDADNEQQLFERITTIPITQILKDKIISPNCALFLQKSLSVNPNLRMSIRELQEFSLKPSRPLAILRSQNNIPAPLNQVGKQRSIPRQKPRQKFNLPTITLNSTKNIQTHPYFLKDSSVNDVDKLETGKVLYSQLMLCEYFVSLYSEISAISLEKTDKIKKVFQKFIERKLINLRACSSENPFNLPHLSHFRTTTEFSKLQSEVDRTIERFKQVFNLQYLPSSSTQINYRQIKEQIMNNITGLFLDSNKPTGVNMPADRKFILDSLVSAYDIVRAASMEDALMFSKAGIIEGCLESMKRRGMK